MLLDTEIDVTYLLLKGTSSLQGRLPDIVAGLFYQIFQANSIWNNSEGVVCSGNVYRFIRSSIAYGRLI
jgi:hypothetical protein